MSRYDIENLNNVKLKNKLKLVRPRKTSNAQQSHVSNFTKDAHDSLYPEHKVYDNAEWKSSQKMGGGLANLGNSCFMNASLQVLGYTTPFFNLCSKKEHSRNCSNRKHFCSFCALEKLINNELFSDRRCAYPREIFKRLNDISRTLRSGRQEDAHEFIRVLLDSMHDACLAGEKYRLKKNPKLEYTSLIYQIWGGELRSTVCCSHCKTESNTDDPMLGISVEPWGTLESSFKKFIEKDKLTGTERYFCEKCKKKRDAYKQMTIKRPPPVLLVHIKRFSFSRTGTRIKIKDHVQFRDNFKISPFLHHESKKDPRYSNLNYKLYAVLVHSGQSAYGGHYYSYVKNPDGTWFMLNDSSVTRSSSQQVSKQQAYILHYQLDASSMRSLRPKVTPKTKSRPSTSVEENKPKDFAFSDDRILLSQLFPNGFKRQNRKKKRDALKDVERNLVNFKSPEKFSKKRKAKHLPQPFSKRRRVSLSFAMENWPLSRRLFRR